jgi:hypothetical protein
MSPGRLVFPYYLQKKLKNYLKKRIVQPPAPVLIASHGEARYPSLWCRLALQTPLKTILFFGLRLPVPFAGTGLFYLHHSWLYFYNRDPCL